MSHGIKRQLTAPYSPQQNDVVERRNWTIMSLVRSMLKEKQLPHELWGEAVSTVVYLLNRSSTHSLQGLTPYVIWTSRRPTIAHLRVFGSLVHVKCTKMPQKKLKDRSTPMVFIGYEVGSTAYRCFDPINGSVHVSRDVVFEEDGKWNWERKGKHVTDLTFFPIISSNQEEGYQNYFEEEEEDSEVQLLEPTSVTPSESEQSEPTRVKTIAQLYEETSPIPSPIDECMVSTDEPMNYEEASREEAWKKALIEEMQAIDRSNTWELVPPPIRCKTIGLKWIFKLKRNLDGDVVRYKARLVVKGYSQKHGIDYDEVFSPVV